MRRILVRAGFQPASFLLVALTGCASHTKTAVVQPEAMQQAMQRQVRNAVDAGDGDYQARTLRAKLDANPRDTAVRLELAAHYRKAGFLDIAIEHCRLACERDPESAEAHLALAKLLRHQNQTIEAVSELAAFADVHKDKVEVWAWLGLLQDETGDWKAGEISHRNAIALAPTRDDLRNNLGYCLLRQDRQPEAAIEFREALKLNPQSTVARNNLGIALAAEPKDAILNWQSVATPADAHSNMAAVLIEAGQYAEARSEINLALSYNQQHSAALNNLRLVSQLDGKAAEIKLPARTSTRFSRARAAWHRFWSGNEGTGDLSTGITTRNSGTPVASR